jgi:hypothetical protein
MSLSAEVKGFFVKASADVDTQAKAIQAKADADIAALRKTHAVKLASAKAAASLAAAKAVYEEHVALLHQSVASAEAATGTTGPTGPAVVGTPSV